MVVRTAFAIFLCIVVCSCNKTPGNDTPKQLQVNNALLTLGTAGSKDSFSIQSNIEWSIVSSASWFTISKTTGSNSSKIYVTATENNVSGNTRSAGITIMPVGTTAVQAVVVTVNQSYEKLSTQWIRLYGGSANEIVHYMAKTSDGGFVMAGGTESSDGDLTPGYGGQDAWLIKVDGNGIKQWSKSYGGSGFDDAMSVTSINDGGYIMAGMTTSTNGDASGNHGGYDYFVLKVDANGTKQWSKVFGGSQNDSAKSVIATTDGGCIVAGETASTNGDLSNLTKGAWIIKLDANGNKQWSKTYGGTGGEEIWSIITTNDGGFAIAGGINVNGSKDAWIIKTDGNGNQQWSKTFGGSKLDIAWSIVATTDGGYVFSGGAGSNNGDLATNYGRIDAWIVKLDANGNKLWNKIYGGSKDDLGDNIVPTPDGGFLLTTSTASSDGDITGNAGESDAMVIKLNANGDKEWSKIYGGLLQDFTECIVSTANGFVIAGLTESKNGIMQGNHGERDGFIIREKIQ